MTFELRNGKVSIGGRCKITRGYYETGDREILEISYLSKWMKLPSGKDWVFEFDSGFTEQLPDIIALSPHVPAIRLFSSGSGIAKSTTDALAVVDNITEVVMSSAPFESLSKWKGLQRLEIHNSNWLTYDHMVWVGQMKQLRHLKLAYCTSCEDDWLKPLTKLKHLTHLKLYDAEQVTDAGIKPLGRLKNLQSLLLWRFPHVKGLAFKENGGFLNLKELILQYCGVGDEAEEWIKKLPQLKKLEVYPKLAANPPNVQ